MQFHLAALATTNRVNKRTQAQCQQYQHQVTVLKINNEEDRTMSVAFSLTFLLQALSKLITLGKV